MQIDYAKLAAQLKERHRLARPGDGLIPSGVMIPLYNKGRETHVLFNLRTQKVKHHKGQICFPGGAAEQSDGSILETAIRETTEEMGIPLSYIHVLGAIDDTVTISGFIVTPIVAKLDHPFPTEICDDEIAELIEVPLAALLSPGMPRIESWDWDGAPVEMYFYDHAQYTIWGATARILKQFLDIAKFCIRSS